MKTLLVMRHAKSSWNDSQQADFDRPLNERGLLTAPSVGQRLRELNLIPEVIFHSSARRATETAQLVARELHLVELLVARQELYLAEPHEILATLARTSQAFQTSSQAEFEPHCVLIVGHNPGVEQLVAHLGRGRAETMPTAALAQLSLDVSRWSEVNSRTVGKLSGFWRPKDSGAAG